MIGNALMLCAALFAGAAMAHDGHGFGGAHLHASDFFGFTVLALGIAGLAWWHRRK